MPKLRRQDRVFGWHRARAALGAVALLILAVSYLPSVYSPDPGRAPGLHLTFRPATEAVMVCAALVGLATMLNARHEPLWNGFDRRRVRGLTLAVVAAASIGVAAYMGLAVWTELHISHWDNSYCRTDVYPQHHDTCIANNARFSDGFRDIVRAGLWSIVAYGFARAGAPPETSEQPQISASPKTDRG
jgi:hypothetical protein